ncbi:MAG: SMC-Scp complex subunit ScpB [Eggerthellaceae bacterium]|nr:SMC-Scp complex subunit ScpB [Eggerthellaceae bacterium]
MFEGIDLDQLPAAIEAMLFVSDEPVSALTLAKMLDENVEEIQEALLELSRKLDEGARGIQLREVAGGWRLFTHPAYHDLVQQYVLSWDTRKLSNAALETLAIVAYCQPMTRAQVSAIRGVTSDGPIATLVERGYLREAGVADTPGNPTLYATTHTFLEKYGLKSPADLPDLEEFAPDEKTAQLIRERLGAPAVTETIPDERDLPSLDQMAKDATASILGVVDKIDFDSLTFNTDGTIQPVKPSL